MHGGGRLLGWLLQLNFIHCVCWGQARHEGLRRFLRLFGLNSGWCALILLDVVDEGLLVAMDLLVLGGRAPLGAFCARLHDLLLACLHFFELSNLFKLLLHFLCFFLHFEHFHLTHSTNANTR